MKYDAHSSPWEIHLEVREANEDDTSDCEEAVAIDIAENIEINIKPGSPEYRDFGVTTIVVSRSVARRLASRLLKHLKEEF